MVTGQDSIIDIATSAAIAAAEADYPRFLQGEALTHIAETRAQEAAAATASEEDAAITTLFVGIYVATYHRRSRSLLARPTDMRNSTL